MLLSLYSARKVEASQPILLMLALNFVYVQKVQITNSWLTACVSVGIEVILQTLLRAHTDIHLSNYQQPHCQSCQKFPSPEGH